MSQKITMKQYRRTFKGICGAALTRTERSKIGTGPGKRKHIGRRAFQIASRIVFTEGMKFNY